MFYSMVEEKQGERLLRLRLKNSLSQYKLSQLSGVNRALIYMVETGKRPLKFDTARKLSPHLKVNTLYLLDGTGEETAEEQAKKTIAEIKEMLRTAENHEIESVSQLVSIPFRGYVPCGVPFPEEQVDGEIVKVPREMLGSLADRNDIFAVKAKGDSMEGAGIHNGQYMIVEPFTTFINNKIYIVRLGNSVVARRVESTPDGKWRLQASNVHYEDLEPDEIELIGKVLMWGGWVN